MYFFLLFVAPGTVHKVFERWNQSVYYRLDLLGIRIEYRSYPYSLCVRIEYRSYCGYIVAIDFRDIFRGSFMIEAVISVPDGRREVRNGRRWHVSTEVEIIPIFISIRSRDSVDRETVFTLIAAILVPWID